MANSFHFNNVKAEKAEALRRYNCQKKFKNFLFLLELLAALALFSWSFYTYIPVVSAMANEFPSLHVALFGQSFYVFMIVNVLILLIYVLSGQRQTKPDFYDGYVSITTDFPRRSVKAAENSPKQEETAHDKQIVFVDNAVNSPVPQNSMPIVTVTDSEKQKHAVSPARHGRVGVVTETKKYRRSRSERFVRENQRELRRSETVVKREKEGEPARGSSAMDDLSSEEFRLTIETFIASRKKSLIRENTLDLKLERNNCLAITLSAFN